MTRIFIKPAPQPKPKDGEEPLPELKVRKPVNGHLKADGEWVNPESYWLRRIKDGDVVLDKEAVEPVEAKPETPVADPSNSKKRN